ncbi:MAG TPA: methyltransferase domain-containing protein [Gemmatimonadaceae bacterium]
MTRADGASGQDKDSEQRFYDELFSRRDRFDQFQPDIYAGIAADARREAPGNRALDLGCGSGTQAVFLAQQGFNVTAIDLSAEAVRLTERALSQTGGSHRVLQGDAENLPIENASIDACVCSLLWHHFSDLGPISRELARVLVPGAPLIAIDANAHNPFAFLFFNVVHRLRPLGGLTPNQRAIGRSEVVRVFSDAGFEGFRFRSLTSELRRDWLGQSLGARLNFYTRRAVLGLSRLVMPKIAHGNILYSAMRRSPVPRG